MVKGKEAALLSNHFLTDDYVEDVLFKIFSQWMMTEINDDSKREELFKQAQAIQGFKRYLNNLETDRRMIEQESPS